MATCSLQSLLDGNCFVDYPAYIQLVLEVQLLCNLLNKLTDGGAITCDPDELLVQASCFNGRPEAVLQAVKLQLLCDISNAI